MAKNNIFEGENILLISARLWPNFTDDRTQEL